MGTNLTRASAELFSRRPDERFSSLGAVHAHCIAEKAEAVDLWQPPAALRVAPDGDRLMLAAGDRRLRMNDWSFTQLCQLARVGKETVNRLSAGTASQVFEETLPRGNKPLQVFAGGDSARSIHGTVYTRLFNADLISVVREFAVDFTPPPVGFNGATGLYCGEQDMFLFLIDPTGWAEVNGEAFAPGFFLWNSEVGRRSVGVETFWFQAVCQNHIVWDAVDVNTFNRKHTSQVHETFGEVRRMIENLVRKRDERRDAFVGQLRKCMDEGFAGAEEAMKYLTARDLRGKLAKLAVEAAQAKGRLTVWSLVDALTRLSGEVYNAGDRAEIDLKAGRLLALAA